MIRIWRSGGFRSALAHQDLRRRHDELIESAADTALPDGRDIVVVNYH